MPTFPVYEGDLPRCLNPLNPRHWLLLLYWIYFRPTALKCYLYQANPEVYRSEGGIANFIQAVKMPAYRNVWLIGISLPFTFSVLFASSVFLFISGFNLNTLSNVLPNFLALMPPMLGIVAFVVAFVVLFVVAGGIAGGIAGGVTISAAFSASIATIGVVSRVATSVVSGVAFGVTISVAFGAATSVVSGVAIGVNTAVAIGVASDVAIDVSGGVAFSVGALRVPFYLIQLTGLFINSRFGQSGHAIAWDELGVLPLPFTSHYLLRQLRRQETEGLKRLSQIIGNPFQRWAVQHSAWRYLHQSQCPLDNIYRWLQTAELDVYAISPSTPSEWRNIISARQLLLAELIGQPINSKGESGLNLERVVYQLTRPLRASRQTPLTQLLRLFYELLYSDKFDVVAGSDLHYNHSNQEERNEEYREYNRDFRLSVYRSIYSAIKDYPEGAEIANSFENMAQFLEFDQIEHLATAQQCLTWLTPSETYLRPAVIQTLQNLGHLSPEIRTYTIASSRVNKLAALARANDALQNLDRDVRSSIPIQLPEHKILRRIIQQWSELITSASGSTGRETILHPVANPYVFGNPVTGKLFVGRDDILNRLEELWMQPGQIPSVVIYGHRRMGKTSILLSLPGRFGANTHIIDFNMQRLGLVQSTNELLYNLALAIYDELPPDWKLSFPEPIEDTFRDSNPYTTFDRFLKKLDPLRQTHRFIITVDEFELIEQSIQDGKLDPHLLDHWRSLIQTYPWFVMAFAGLHTLQEMTQNYWNPLFGSVTRVPVSFLSRADAIELIANPTEDFSLDYDSTVLDEIYNLTGGQPYLIQLICHSLVSRFNRQRFEERREIEPRFTPADIETIITSSDFYRDGNAYFRGVWEQAKESHGTTQTTILRCLSQNSLTYTALRQQIPIDDLDYALQLLQDHDVIQIGEESCYCFQVELMRRWVKQFSDHY